MSYDRVLAPHHYDVRSDAEDPDAEIDRLLAEGSGAPVDVSGSSAENGGTASSAYGVSRLDSIVPRAQYTRPELLRIMAVSVGQLTSSERRVRTLLAKFHDAPAAVAAAAVRGVSGLSTSASGPIVTSSGGLFSPSAVAAVGDFPSSNSVTPAAVTPGAAAIAGSSSVIPTPAAASGARTAANATPISDDPQSGGTAGGLQFRVDKASGALVYDTRGEGSLEVLDRRARKFTAEPHFHTGASPYSMAHSAIPIPRRAPAKLRQLLQARADRLSAMWAAVRRDPRNAVEADVIGGVRTITEDVDERARDLLSEMDRAYGCSRETMDSNVLHGREQRFPVAQLRGLLEDELDRVLVSQVTERELIEASIMQQKVDAHLATAEKVAAAEIRRLTKRREAAMQRMMLREAQRVAEWQVDSAGQGQRVLMTDFELHERRRKAEAADQLAQASASGKKAGRRGSAASSAAAPAGTSAGGTSSCDADADDGIDATGGGTTSTSKPDIYVGGEFAYDERDPINELGSLALWGDPSKPPTPKRIAAAHAAAEASRMRERERMRAARDSKDPDRQARLIAVWKKRRAKALEHTSEGQAQLALAQLGPGGCLACMTAPCKWAPPVPVAAIKERLREVEQELLRVRCMADNDSVVASGSSSQHQQLVQSTVPLSFHRGGPARMPKADLVFNLAFEAAGLHDKLRLAELDKELHDVSACSGDTVTTLALHGHPQTTWKANAVTSLQRQIAPLVARQAAEEAVDDILQYMYEGWHFGEHASELAAAGNVPSFGLKASGIGAAAASASSSSSAAARAGQLGPAARAAVMDAARGLRPLVFLSSTPPLLEDGSTGPGSQQQQSTASQLAVLLPSQFVTAARPRPATSTAFRRGSAKVPPAAASVSAAAPLPPATRISNISGRRGGSQADYNSTQSVELRQALSAEVATQRKFESMLNSSGPLSLTPEGQLAPYDGGGAVPAVSQQLVPHPQHNYQQAMIIVPGTGTAVPAVTSQQQQPSEMVRISSDTQWKAISNVAAAREVLASALQTQRETMAGLDDSETVLRTGMFLIALHYFRLMNDVSKLKDMFSGRGGHLAEAMAAAGVPSFSSAAGVDAKKGPHDSSLAPLTSNPTIAAADKSTLEACANERERMNAAERARMKRQAALALANAKALAGWGARAQRIAEAAAHERKAATMKARRRTREQAAAVAIQRMWRGYHVRNRFHDYLRALRYGETLSEQRHLAALRIQALWRGHLARQFAADLRAELEAFIKLVRNEEKEELIEAYYEANSVKAGVDSVKGYFARRRQGRAVAKVAKQRLLDDDVIRARLGPGVLTTAARNKERVARRGELDISDLLHHEMEEDGSKGALPALLRNGVVLTIGDRVAVNDPVDDANAQHRGREAGPIDLDALGDDAAFFGIRRPPKRRASVAAAAAAGAAAGGASSNNNSGSKLPALPAAPPLPALKDAPSPAHSGGGSIGNSNSSHALPRLGDHQHQFSTSRKPAK